MNLKRHSPFRRHAYALIELPLVIFLFLAVVGIIMGAFLWYRNGAVTAGAWVGFSFVLPLGALLALVFFSGRRHRKRSK